MLTLNDGRKELYQWDTGRIATIDIDCDVVHFSNLKYGDSLAVEVKEGEAAIPNKLLMSGAQIYCWAFAKDDSGAYTKQEQTLPVIKRAKPSDYVYTETETLTWKSLDERITELEKGGTGGSGIDGEDGATFIPYVSESGIISWTNDKGLRNPEPVNIKGTTPHIGENGNWFIGDTDTGVPATGEGASVMVGATSDTDGASGLVPAPAAGDEGKFLAGDGTWKTPASSGGGTDLSLGVSGAAVGQTVRITAVDESGKPTAWEAVDVEGGGTGAWRLLNDITTTEEIAGSTGIRLNSADDGTPYNLKELVFTWDCPAGSGGSYATFKVNGKLANGITSRYYFGSGNYYTNSAVKAVGEIRALGDAAYLHSTTGISDYGSSGENVNVMYDYPGEFETIASVEFSVFGDVVYPAGLKLKIWGCEA